MKGYGEYKNTGYDWLPAVPAHWDISTIRSLLQLSDTRCGVRSDLELLSVYREYGVIKKKSRDDNHNKASLDISNYKYVGKYHVVMNKMKMWQGSLGVSAFEGIVSPAYIVCIVKKDLNLKYLNFLLRSHSFKTFYNRISYGIRVGQWDLRYDDLKALNVFLPPREEQDQIVRYLDTKVSKINTLIKIKQKQIALLKEKKQAIINQAVTKGLDPNAPMKDSGIAWIGQIPEGWEVKKLKRFMTKIVQGWSPQCENRPSENDELCVLKVGCVNDIYFDASQNKVLPKQLSPQRDIFLKKGMIIVSRANTKQLVGLASLVENDLENVMLCDKLYSFFVNTKKLNSKFAVYSLRSTPSREHIENNTNGASSSMQNITQSTIRELNIAFPSVEIQNVIVSFCNEKIRDICRLTDLHTKQIAHLAEYRTRLISDVVTGKIDVRGLPVDSLDEDTLQDLALEDVESMESEDAEEGIYDTP